MTQKNHSEVNDEGVSVTTTPISSVAASATAKLSAAADTSTSFNVKSATSIVALDTYSIGCLSMATSKKIGTGVTYQCGKNIAAFSTSSKGNSYVHAKTLTFAYENGMALRGKNIEIANRPALTQSASGALCLLAAGSVAAPVASLGVNHTGQSKKWETAAEKQKRISEEKLNKKKKRIDELNQTLEEKKSLLSKLEQKKSDGTLTSEEAEELKKIHAGRDERDKLQKEIEADEAKKKKRKAQRENIGGSPSDQTSLEISNKSSFAGMGTSALAGVGTAIAAANTIFSKAQGNDASLCMTSADGDFVINATGGRKPSFKIESYANALFTEANKKSSLTIKQETADKKAEFGAIARFVAKTGNNALVCSPDSVKFGFDSKTVKIGKTGTVLRFGSASLKVTDSKVNVAVGSVTAEFLPNRLRIGNAEFVG